MADNVPKINKLALGQHTYMDIISRYGPDGKIITNIAEIMNEQNQMIGDMSFVECNNNTSHKVVVRTGLPQAYWKRMNKGIPPSKSTVATIEETCGMCGAVSQIDSDEIKINNNNALYRFTEEKAFIETMNQEMTNKLFYGRKAEIEGFEGFTPRYNTLDPKTPTSKNVIDAGGKSDGKMTSIWLIGWGTDSIFGIFPKGMPLGLQHKDCGEKDLFDGDGYTYLGYKSYYRWNMGLCVKDWRYAVRICNVDPKEIIQGKGAGTGDLKVADSFNLLMMLDQATQLIPTGGSQNFAFYMNSDALFALSVTDMRTNLGVVTYHEIINKYGMKRVECRYRGIPIRRVDQLQNNEKTVTADPLLEVFSVDNFTLPKSKASAKSGSASVH